MTERQEGKDNDCCRFIGNTSAAASAHERPLAREQRLKQADEWNLAIEEDVPNSYLGLPGENLDHLKVWLTKKIRIFSFVKQQSHAALVIGEWQRVECTVAGLHKSPVPPAV